MINNYKEAQALVDRYRTVTLEEINAAWDHQFPTSETGLETAYKLIGFGRHRSCTLCIKSSGNNNGYDRNCSKCIYECTCGCFNGAHNPTYQGIAKAKTPEDLLAAFRARAEHIKMIVNKKRKKTVIR